MSGEAFVMDKFITTRQPLPAPKPGTCVVWKVQSPPFLEDFWVDAWDGIYGELEEALTCAPAGLLNHLPIAIQPEGFEGDHGPCTKYEDCIFLDGHINDCAFRFEGSDW